MGPRGGPGSGLDPAARRRECCALPPHRHTARGQLEGAIGEQADAMKARERLRQSWRRPREARGRLRACASVSECVQGNADQRSRRGIVDIERRLRRIGYRENEVVTIACGEDQNIRKTGVEWPRLATPGRRRHAPRRCRVRRVPRRTVAVRLAAVPGERRTRGGAGVPGVVASRNHGPARREPERRKAAHADYRACSAGPPPRRGSHSGAPRMTRSGRAKMRVDRTATRRRGTMHLAEQRTTLARAG